MIFIELVTDAFVGQVDRIGHSMGARSAGKSSVRRPLRGIEIKEDTYAYIKLIRADGKEIPMFDSGSKAGVTEELSNFLLRSVTDQRMERNQVIETFGESYLFLFGEAPRFLQVQASLLNTLDFQWRDEFMKNYNEYLRGTKAIERGARTYLFYNQNIFEGYILNCNITDAAEPFPYLNDLQFQFFVTNHTTVSFVGEGRYPLHAGVSIPKGLLGASNEEEVATATDYLELASRELGVPVAANLTRPVRTYFEDNEDEWTNGKPAAQAATPTSSVNDKVHNVKNINETVGDVLQAYGADKNAAHSPTTADRLGFSPNILPGGSGIGTAAGGSRGGLATFSPSANNISTPGGYAGVKLPSTNTAFGDTYAGVGASAKAGAYSKLSEGSSLGAGATTDTLNTGALSLAGKGVGATSTNVQQSVPLSNASAAYAKNDVYSQSYSDTFVRKAAIAGGYTGSNAFLTPPANKQYVGASVASNTGGGATIHVAGKVSAFSSAVIQGELVNADITFDALFGV